MVLLNGFAEINAGKILSQMPRDEFWFPSKAGYDMWPGPYGMEGVVNTSLPALDQSLKRTGLDYFDIFYSHCFDASVPFEETLAALDTVHQGKLCMLELAVI